MTFFLKLLLHFARISMKGFRHQLTLLKTHSIFHFSFAFLNLACGSVDSYMVGKPICMLLGCLREGREFYGFGLRANL